MSETLVDIFDQINNAVLDLQQADYGSYQRPLKTLARLLAHDDLADVNTSLTGRVDLEAFLKSGDRRGGMGPEALEWPENIEEELGLALRLIQRFAADPEEMWHFGHAHYASGSGKIISDIRAVTSQLIIPFVRDYRDYVRRNGKVKPALVKPQSDRIFIVHGHDEGAREMVARFVEQLGFKAIILHEQANKGRTIINKFREEAGDIGFAIVLMTPDDHGGKAGAATKARARQNVVFELGFFIGQLGPVRVAAMVKGDVERPSDFDGVVYIPLDDSGWKLQLAKELEAADYNIDWKKVGGR